MNFLKNLFETIVKFFGMTKILSNVKNIAIVLLAFYFSGTQFNAVSFFLGIVSLSSIFSAVYAYNNISDFYIDKKNNEKKHYSESVEYFGKKNAFTIFFILVVISFLLALFINIYFLTTLIVLFIAGIMYSSPAIRFKEKFLLDFLFGATFTYLLRFISAWFIFSISFPPILPILALISAKTGGYILYKQGDAQFLKSLGVKNTATIIKKKETIIFSIFLWIITFISVFFLFINAKYLNIKILGSLPLKFLILSPFAIPPLAVIYLYTLGALKMSIKNLRILGFIYWLSFIIVFWLFFL